MERSVSEIEAANARLMIINSFLVASTTILLTLNVSIIKGSIAEFVTHDGLAVGRVYPCSSAVFSDDAHAVGSDSCEYVPC